MQCPVCDGKMREVAKHGVEVDICPDCKGVWLDRGELEKIIDMVANGSPEPVIERPRDPEPQREYREPERRYESAPEYREPDKRYEQDRNYRENDHGKEHDRQIDPRTGKPRKKRESWFGEIFDMFGD